MTGQRCCKTKERSSVFLSVQRGLFGLMIVWEWGNNVSMYCCGVCGEIDFHYVSAEVVGKSIEVLQIRKTTSDFINLGWAWSLPQSLVCWRSIGIQVWFELWFCHTTGIVSTKNVVSPNLGAPPETHPPMSFVLGLILRGSGNSWHTKT